MPGPTPRTAGMGCAISKGLGVSASSSNGRASKRRRRACPTSSPYTLKVPLAGPGDWWRGNARRKPLLDAAGQAALAALLEVAPPDGGLWSGRKVAAWMSERLGPVVDEKVLAPEHPDFAIDLNNWSCPGFVDTGSVGRKESTKSGQVHGDSYRLNQSRRRQTQTANRADHPAHA